MFINVNTHKVYSEQEIRLNHREVSFPVVLTDVVLAGYGYASLTYLPVPTVGMFERAEQMPPALKDGCWVIGWKVTQVSDQERTQIIQSIKFGLTNAIQGRLDKFAQDHGYDNILSLCTYATSSVERFRREGQRGVDLRDQTWMVADQINKDVNAGKRSIPMSFEEIESEFPPLVM